LDILKKTTKTFGKSRANISLGLLFLGEVQGPTFFTQNFKYQLQANESFTTRLF
jgi:hypothetical protein